MTGIKIKDIVDYARFDAVPVYRREFGELDDLFKAFMKMPEPRSIFVPVSRGDISEYGDLEELIAEDFVKDEEELTEYHLDAHPYETEWYKFSMMASDSNDFRTFYVNDIAVICDTTDLDCKRPGCEVFYSSEDFRSFLREVKEEVEKACKEKESGRYIEWLEKNLPERYRYGVISRKKFAEITGEKLCGNLTDEEISKFLSYYKEYEENSENAPECITGLTVNKYLEICEPGWRAIDPERAAGKSKEELYKIYADDRDGGMMYINRDSVPEFERWYQSPTEVKWQTHNPSHMWEAIQGSSSTRIHLYPKREAGRVYCLYLSVPRCLCCEETVRFYNALRDAGTPVRLINGCQLYEVLTFQGNLGITPCYCEGYSAGNKMHKYDENVFESFSSGHEMITEEVLKNVEWAPAKNSL